MIKPPTEKIEVVAYDFRRPSRISPERQRLLEATHEQLAQSLQAWVSGRLRTAMSFTVASIGQLAYAEFVSELPEQGAHFLYEVQGRPGMVALVAPDVEVAFVLIERLLGGDTVSPPPERSLTPLERVVMRIVTDRIAHELASVWRDHVELELMWSRFETAPELIEMAGREDDVLVVKLAVSLRDAAGIIRVALPFPVLESFFSRGTARRLQSSTVSREERLQERQRLEHLVLRASAVVSARLPTVKIPLRALSDLRVGDVLPTAIHPSSQVEVLVAGARRFVAREGRIGPRVGIEITGPWRGRARQSQEHRLNLESYDGE